MLICVNYQLGSDCGTVRVLAHVLGSTQFHPLLPCLVARRNNEVGNKEMETGHQVLQVAVMGMAQWLCSEGFKVISTDWKRHLCELDPVAQLLGLN